MRNAQVEGVHDQVLSGYLPRLSDHDVGVEQAHLLKSPIFSDLA